ncbi:fruit protein pKIWI502-like [Zingiber officinale]|uniref:fruit protein pKIWI502-like n=1 Tax=Zingiber officinale TaxID=94328 RepID=UPI001C4A89C6|nr:fruit protein pKIWI502-like [Zingiber officinale]
MTYQESFKDWESIGVKIIPILSQPDERWSGERGYVQTAFSRAKDILNPSSTVVVLCGRKQMAEFGFIGVFAGLVPNLLVSSSMLSMRVVDISPIRVTSIPTKYLRSPKFLF